MTFCTVGAGHASDCFPNIARAHGALPQIGSTHLKAQANPVGAGHARDCITAVVGAYAAHLQIGLQGIYQ